VFKGSISIEGISLTVAKLEQNRSMFECKIAIIPHTVEMTNLGSLKPGDPVNLEADLIAKYVEKMIKGEPTQSSLTVEELVRQGFYWSDGRLARPQRCLPGRAGTPGVPPANLDRLLRFQLQLIQFQKLMNDGLDRFLHFLVRSKENRLAFVQEDNTIGQLLGQAHVVRDDD